jgi:AcrR family transcriptional regulator
MGRKPLDHDRKREEIARAAGRAIVERGLSRLKLSDIASQLGVTTGTLQHYFDTKDDLLRHTKDLFVDQRVRSAVESARDLRGIDRLQAMATALTAQDEEAIDMWKIVLANLGNTIGHEGTMRQQVARYRSVQDLFAEEIRSLQRDGAIRAGLDADLEAFALISYVEGLAIQTVFSPGRGFQPSLSRLVKRYLHELLGT